jgi:ferredoxin-type protein NapH
MYGATAVKRKKRRVKPHRLGQIIASIITLGHVPALWTGYIYQGGLKSVCVPILNCWGCPLSLFSCPIGALQHFLNLHLFPFYIIGFFGAVGMLVGRMVCGWLCPFGLLQDLLQKIKSVKWSLPKWMTYIKYGVLVIVVGVIAWTSAEPWFCKLCPAGILEAGMPLVFADTTGDIRALVGWLFWVKIMILAVVVALSVPIKRFFCRTFCPIGAIYSLFNRYSLIHLKIDREKCKHPSCGFCKKICPMDINVYDDPNQRECIRCLECVYKCPNIAVSTSYWTPAEKRTEQTTS